MAHQPQNRRTLTDNTGHATGMQDSTAIYSDNVVMNGRQGHGFAAEKANHLADRLSGNDAQLIGGDNAKNGADRLVNGQLIQTKYCETGSRCIAEAFDDDGVFRYPEMQIEVPADQYESAVDAMKKRIEKGQVPNVTDPSEATNIVRKGRFTYKQARNIAKAGTVESLTYDAVNGIKLAGTTMGITALLTFAVGIWQGKSKAEALDAACFSGICVGGVAWVTSILASQVGRTGLESSMRTGSEWVVRKMNKKVVEALANAFRNGNNIAGEAAVKHAAKLLRGQIAVTIVVTAVLSVDDFIALFSREISGTQAFKNICKTCAGVAGGSAGAWGGAAAGAKLGALGGPVTATIGTMAGGIIGGAAGGWGASTVAKAGLDAAIDDDSVAIEKLMNQTFGQLGDDYLLSEEEAYAAIADFRTLDMENTIRAIYAADDREQYTHALMQPFFERVASQRPPVFRPPRKKLAAATEKVLEQLEHTEFETQPA